MKRIGIDVSEQIAENEIVEKESMKEISEAAKTKEEPMKSELKKENLTKDKDVALKTGLKKEKLKTEKK